MGEASYSDSNASFATTQWAQIRAARTATPDHRKAVLQQLATRYWRPVYGYLRARGHNEADACDLTQAFFADVVLGRDLFEKAEPARGRFRAFLLHSLKNYVRDQRRREGARRRAPDTPIVSIQAWVTSDTAEMDLPDHTASPEQIFQHRWAAGLVDGALARLRQECDACSQAVHFEIFEQRVAQPTLLHETSPSAEALGERYGLTAQQVRNRTETVRRRFRRVLLDEVGATLTDPAQAEAELRALMEALGAPEA